jgi:hypothetical protein
VNEEDKDISPSLGIEIWYTGPFSRVYNNRVSRWLSLDSSPGSEVYDNTVAFIGGTRSVGIEVVACEDSRIYGNVVRGAETGISVDQGNENTILENNSILDATHVGIHVVNCWIRQCGNITIRNNLIDTVRSGGDGAGKRGIFLNWSDISDSVIERNSIRNTGGSGIYLYGTNRVLVKDNFIYCYAMDPVSPGIEDDIYFNDANGTILEGNRTLSCGEAICNTNGTCELGENGANCPEDCREPFFRGDANVDTFTDIADAVFILGYLFAGRDMPACRDAADANDDGRVDIADGLYLFQYLFASGPALPAPSGACSIDPTADGLDCARYPYCER